VRSYTIHVPSLHQKAITCVVFFLGAFLCFTQSTLAASFSLAPSSGAYTVGSTFSVGVYVGSGGTAMNAASGIVSFPEDLLEVTSISKNQSIISLWVQEPSFSNGAGTINYEGIVLNPGYTGNSGKILTLTFRVKAQGTAALSFSSGSILANDGSGTEILTSKSAASFLLEPKLISDPAPVVDAPASTPVAGLPLPKIESVTHKAEMWSNSTTGVFNFVEDARVVAMRLLLDETPDAIPTVVYEPPIALREITDIKDGVSYLHVQYKTSDGWGDVLHYKLQVDTKVPSELTVVKDLLGATETVSFVLSAKDGDSGIDRFEIQIDGGTIESFKADGTGTYTYATQKRLVAGAHTMVVSAFDKAGNVTRTTTEFITAGPVSESLTPADANITERAVLIEKAESLITLLSVVVPIVALVMLLSWLTFTMWRAYGGLKRKIAKDVLSAQMVVHKSFALLRDDISVDIETLKKASTKRKLTREEAKILKRLQKNITEAEKVITTEIADIEEGVK
jgi:hypothetical protein